MTCWWTEDTMWPRSDMLRPTHSTTSTPGKLTQTSTQYNLNTRQAYPDQRTVQPQHQASLPRPTHSTVQPQHQARFPSRAVDPDPDPHGSAFNFPPRSGSRREKLKKKSRKNAWKMYFCYTIFKKFKLIIGTSTSDPILGADAGQSHRSFVKLDPHPYWEKQLDPDPPKMNADPQPGSVQNHVYNWHTVESLSTRAIKSFVLMKMYSFPFPVCMKNKRAIG